VVAPACPASTTATFTAATTLCTSRRFDGSCPASTAYAPGATARVRACATATQTVSENIPALSYPVGGLEKGKDYYFRISALTRVTRNPEPGTLNPKP